MTQYTTGAELRGYHPGNDSTLSTDADYVIPGDDIRSLDLGERAEEYKDSAKVTVDNDGGKYTHVTHGDRLEFYVRTGAPADSGYGEGGYGAGPYGSDYRRRWTGLVRNYSITGEGAQQYTLSLSGEDFVYAVLGMRQVYDSFRGQQIVGPNGILNSILEDEAPEIDRSQLPALNATTDISFNGESLFDAVVELAARAECLLSAQGTVLHFEPPENLQSQFVVEPADIGVYDVKSSDDSLINQWRIDGGTAPEMDDVQETADGYQTVTETSRIQHQINHPKSEVAQVEVWTRTTGSGEGIRVRLQKNAGGVPEDPGNRKKDIARETNLAEFLDDDGWTTFLLPENDTPSATPWLIIEADGSGGQDIGINVTTGEPAYRAYFSYPVDISLPEPDSQDRYRRREDRVKDDSLDTFKAAEETARARLRNTAAPTKTVTVPAESDRMHTLVPGEVVTLDKPEVEATGKFAVTERSDDYEGAVLETTLSLRELPPSFAEDVAPPPTDEEMEASFGESSFGESSFGGT